MAWLEEPPKPIVIKNDMLLRLFFYRQLPREKVLSITAAHIEQLKAFKLELDEIEATEGSWADKFQYDTLRWGKDFYDFQISWYEKLLYQLENETSQ
jgi:hypothetical protein